MNLSPVRTALRHKADYVCLPCLLRTCFTPRWQQPIRAGGSGVIVPNLSPSVATSLHDTIDRIDRADRAQRFKSELKKKPPTAKVDGSRPKSPSPQSPSASSEKFPVLRKTYQDPVTATSTATSKVTAARNRTRVKKPHEDRPETQEALSQTKSHKRQDVSSEETASRERSSTSKLLGNRMNRHKRRDAVPAAKAQLSKSSSNPRPRSRLEKPADAEVEEQHEDQVKEGGVGRSPTGTGETDNASMERLDLAKPPSNSIPPTQSPTDVKRHISTVLGRRPALKPSTTKKFPFGSPTKSSLKGSPIEKVRSDSPPQSLMGGLLVKKTKSDDPLLALTEAQPVESLQSLIEGMTKMKAISDSPLEHLRNLRPKHHALITKPVRRVRSTVNVPELILIRDQGEAGRPMTLEKRLKKDSISWQAATGNKVLRKVKLTVVRRTVSREQTEKEPVESKAKPTIQHINAVDLNMTAVKIDQPPVPTLAYGLERVLFNPGVYHLQDPRSRVYNFDPYLQTIMPTSEFDFSALKEYITSSRDEALISIAEEQGKRYVGSSSSMTGVLAQFHFLLSQWRKINTSMVSRGFPDKLESFTVLQRSPTAIFLRWKEGTYAIDADKEFATSNILSMLGKSMEKLLTLKTEHFERYRKSNPAEVPEEERNTRDSFHYSTMGDFLMRSQLDAHDPRLPGTGMFDLKTRAVVSVRMNIADPVQGSGYEIQGRLGEWESYEREYFDMIRSAFLKYSLQVRMGRMDGIFVAFHNTERIFGFQYVSLEEMDLALHGQYDKTLGNQEFKLSIDLLNTVLDKATERFPKQSIRLHFETRDASTNFMYIFAEPVTEEQIEELQSKNSAAIEAFERELLGLSKDAEKDHPDEWDEIQAKVDEVMDKDERGVEEAGECEDIAPAVKEFDDGRHITEEVAAYEEGEDESNVHIVDGLPNGAAIDDAEETREEDLNEEDEELEESEDSEVEESQKDERLLDEADDVEDIAEDEAAAEVHETEDAQDGEEGEEYEIKEDEADVEETHVEDPHLEESAIEPPIVDVSTTDPSFDSQEPSDSSANSEAPGDSAPTSADATTTEPPEFDSTADPAFLDDLATESTALESKPPILAMTLTIRNKVDGKYVLRPGNLTTSTASASDKAPKPPGWSVEYTLREVEDRNRAWTLYAACQERRRKQLDKSEGEENVRPDNARFLQMLRDLTARGREYRETVEKRDVGKEKVVLGWESEGAKVERGVGIGDGGVDRE